MEQFDTKKYEDTLGEFHVEIFQGWYSIIYKLLDEFVNLAVEGNSVKIVQIKEKFGGLRVYVDLIGSDEFKKKIRALISSAEKESLLTCEICSKPGKLENIDGWFVTVCKDHSKPIGDNY